MDSKILTVSDLMVDTLIRWGVRHVFGMVGHSNLGLAEAIRKRCVAGDMEFIGVRHEGAASFAASAYAKVAGVPAACLSIAGPGATNMLTGLWDAKLDRAPLLALTGQVDIQYLGPGGFQEVDLTGAFESATCWSQTVLESSNHVELMNLALKNAIQQRDVSHLIFPNTVQELPVPPDALPGGPEGRIPQEKAPPSDRDVENAASLLRDAKRPAIIMGYGCRDNCQAVTAFAEAWKIPVMTTFKAKGMIPDRHPLACGVVGLSGSPIAMRTMRNADLLIVLGASFSKHSRITRDVPTIQVDLDQAMLGRFHSVALPVWGDIHSFLIRLTESVSGQEPKQDPAPDLAQQWAAWRATKAKRAAKDQGKGISSAAVFEAMGRWTPSDAIIAADVGDNTYSFGRYFECAQQRVILSGYLGSIGFGYPAAMGAWCACPEKPVVAVTGDGGFGQYMGELTTAVKYGIPIKHILLNNSQLGKIVKEQKADKKEVWATSLHNPDFAQYARLCGAWGERVETASQLDAALEQAFAHEGPAMVEVITDGNLT